MRKFLSYIFRIFSFIYPYKLSQWIIGYKNLFYTLWIKNFIGKLGDHSILSYPCFLQGDGLKNIRIGNYTTINKHTIIGCWTKYGKNDYANANIQIGNNCLIGEYSHITSCNSITIGDGLLTGRYVLISDNSHGTLSSEESSTPPINRELKTKGGVVIGNNVWLGDKVAIMAGVHIGNNVIVAANAVITNDIPDNCLVAGVPGKIIKQIK